MKTVGVCVLVSAIACFVLPVLAATMGTEYAVSDPGCYQVSGSLSSYGEHGNFFVQPVSKPVPGSATDIYVYELDKDSGDLAYIETDPSEHGDLGVISAHDSGVTAILWHEDGWAYVKVLDFGAGNTLLSKTQISSSLHFRGYDICGLGGGNFMVVWSHVGGTTVPGAIRARRLTRSGSSYTVGAVQTVEDNIAEPCWYPCVAATGDGNAICVYQRAVSPSGDDPEVWDWDIKAEVLDGTGSPVDNTDYDVDVRLEPQTQPRVAYSAQDNIGIVVWEDHDSSTDIDLNFSPFTYNPSTEELFFSAEQDLHPGTGKTWMPDIAFDSYNKAFVIVYASLFSTDDNDILAREVRVDDGSVSISYAQTLCNDSYNQVQPAVAYNKDHDCLSFLITWTDYRAGGPKVYARSYQIPITFRALRVYSSGTSYGVNVTATADFDGYSSGTTYWSFRYVDGTPVTMSVPSSVWDGPDDEWKDFDHWQCGGDSYSSRQLSFDMLADYTFTAVYVPRPVTLSYIEISGPTQVDEDSGAQYTCTAYYSDGSSVNVSSSASWSENSSYASINSSGYLTTLSVASDQYCQILATYGGKSDTHDITIKNIPVTLSYIEISGSTQVDEDSGEQYTCTAYYSDGSSVNVSSSASWSENSAYASINSSGYLTTVSVPSDQSCTISASFEGKSDTHNVTIKNIPATLSHIEISGPSEVYESSGAQYICTAYYSDGSSSNVSSSANWSVDAGSTEISSAGLLSVSDLTEDEFCTVTAIYGGLSDTFDVALREAVVLFSGIELTGGLMRLGLRCTSGTEYCVEEGLSPSGPWEQILGPMTTATSTHVETLIAETRGTTFYRICTWGGPPCPVARTGQTNTYQIGDDGQLRAGVEWLVPRFMDTGEGSAIDTLTGLEWIKAPHSLPGNSHGTHNWYNAVEFCSALEFACHTDWRLPTRREFISLFDWGQENPTLPIGHPFLDLREIHYWTSTTMSYETNGAYRAFVFVGELFGYFDKNWSGGCAWPVRKSGATDEGPKSPVPLTGQSQSYHSCDDGDLQAGIPWPNPRFADNGDGTVRDNLTGLVWVKAPHTIPANSGGMKWSAAINYCNSLDFADMIDWRLPNVRELESLLHSGRGVWGDQPCEWLNSAETPFSGIQEAEYWSSTSRSSSYGISVNMGTGAVLHDLKDHYYWFVWPVRGVVDPDF